MARPEEPDSIDRDLPTWTRQMVDVDPDVEAARQRIGRLARLFGRTLEQVASAEGLSLADWEALSVVVRSDGPCTPTVLAQTLGLTSGTVSIRLNRLLDAGLVTVVADADGRSRPVTITELGHRRWQRATAARTRAERDLFEVLDGRELVALNDLLRPLLRRYEDALGEAPRHDRS